MVSTIFSYIYESGILMKELIIRTVSISDVPTIITIYFHYVLHTAITFEDTVPTIEEFSRRSAFITSRYPYIMPLYDIIKVYCIPMEGGYLC